MKQFGTLVFFLVACGEVGDRPPDATGPTDDGDIAIDAPPDAPAGPVRVSVLNYAGDGIPDNSARVTFQDPAGAVVFEGTVDIMGKLEAPFPTGGSVTSVRIVADSPTQLRAEITTIMGVKPGDELTIGFKRRPNVTNQGGQTSMQATYFPLSTAGTHQFFTTCGVANGGATSPVTLNFRDSCHGAQFDLLVVASGGMLTTPRFTRVTGIAHENAGSFTVPAGFTTMGNFTVNATNIPDEISSMSVSRASMIENAVVANQTVAQGDPPGGTLSALVPFANGFGARSEIALTMARPDAVGTQRHDMRTAALGISADVDLARQVVPWYKDFVLRTDGVTWATAVPGDEPDGAMTIWSGRWVIGERTTLVGWRIFHPVSDTGITLPRLSPTFVELDPQAQSVTVSPLSSSVNVIDYDNVDGYDQLRQQADTLFTTPLENMGAFIGQPFQRRLYNTTVLP